MTEPDDDKRFQFAPRTVLIATALSALFVVFAVWIKATLLLLTVAIFLAACCAWRATGASRLGIATWTIGGELLTVAAYGAYVAPAEREFRISAIMALVGVVVLIVAGAIFLFFACKRKPSRWQNVSCCVASFLLPVAWALIFHPIAREACFARIMKRDAEYAKFVAEVNAICVRLGHAPESEKELVKLLGKRMPQIILTASETVPMSYKQLGSSHFKLSFINSNGKVQVYDSRAPERAWFEEP